MTLNEAIYKMSFGNQVRNENFASGTYCWMNTDGTIEDPELGTCTETEFRNFYKYFEDGWYNY